MTWRTVTAVAVAMAAFALIVGLARLAAAGEIPGPGGESRCLSLAVFQDGLARAYGEHLVGARGGPGGVMLFYGSDAGTWTLARADPLTWRACVVAVGRAWPGRVPSVRQTGRRL